MRNLNREQRRWLEKLIRKGILFIQPKVEDKFFVNNKLRYKYPSLESYEK